MKIPGYYTITEAAAALNLSRPGAEKAVQREGWKYQKIGNVHLYTADDIHEYRDHRLRTELVKKMGWGGRGLYRDGTIDIECPECGAFAIEWPPLYSEKILCVEGHNIYFHDDSGTTELDDYK